MLEIKLILAWLMLAGLMCEIIIFSPTYCMQQEKPDYFENLLNNLRVSILDSSINNFQENSSHATNFQESNLRTKFLEILTKNPELGGAEKPVNCIELFFNKKSLNKEKDHLENSAKCILNGEFEKLYQDDMEDENNDVAAYYGIDPTDPCFTSQRFEKQEEPPSDRTKIEKYKKEILNTKNPELCLFGECPCFSRKKRTKIELAIINKETVGKMTETLTYLGFAPGDLLQDLKIIIILILNKKKKLKTVHLVDTKYDNKLTVNLKLVSENKKKLEDLSAENFLKIIQLTQFIKIISELQGETIRLVAHDYLKSYIRLCKNNPDETADIATVIDPPEAGTLYCSSPDSGVDPNRIICEYGLKNDGLICSNTGLGIKVKI